MIDFALIVDTLPERGGDSLSSRRLMTAGGGYNVMSAARRQGINAMYVGQLGVGRFADIARGVLLNEGIQLALSSRGNIDLGVCVVLVDQTGERTFVTSPGAELTLQTEDLAGVSPVRGDVVYVSGYNVVYPEVAQLVSEWLSSLPGEVIVAFDPGPRSADIEPEIMARVIERTDWLLCNISEAKLWCASDDAGECAGELLSRGDHSLVVVRDGSRGCAGVHGDGLVRAAGFDAQVVDTNGAGDVHNGVLIAERLMGNSFEEALLRANAAASIAIESFGPATCPTRNLVDALLIAQPGTISYL